MAGTNALANRFRALDRALRPGFTRHLRRFFAGQAARAVATYLALDYLVALTTPKPQPAPEQLLPDIEQERLRLAMLPFLLQAALGAGGLAGELVGLTELTDQEPRIARLLQDVGLQIVGIHRTTLNAVRDTLAVAVRRGYTAQQVADGVPADGYRGLRAVVTETYKGRADTIARTELARITSLAALERYQEAGSGWVYVIDGKGCGWLWHGDPDKASDTFRTVIDAQQHALAHPNCVRRFTPGPPARNRLPVAGTARRPRITVDVTGGGVAGPASGR